ncbi:MAG: GNAT family N-acetyltransferase [Actinobacteria bacterium]|nr:MAG: GNAT family N-acetyltransferase [Actinomycetota bacterium]
MSFDVRPCADLDEFSHAMLGIGQYFSLELGSERLERFSKNLPIERMHAAREDGNVVGGAGAFPFEVTVPGAIVPAAGVTVVGTYPTHRRRGVLRAMMRAQLDDVHERGELLALLFSSEETIYGRYGYGLASFAGEISLPRESPFAAPLEPRGRMRLVEKEEAQELFPHVWEAVRPRVPGMLGRTSDWWEYRILFDSPDTREATPCTGTGPSGSTSSPPASSTWSRRWRSTAVRLRSSGASCSTSTGPRESRPGFCRSITSSSTCWHTLGAWVSVSSTGSGPVSSTSERPSPHEATPARAAW